MKMRRWLLDKLTRRMCTKMRPEWVTVDPASGVERPQVVLQIIHICDGMPVGRVYLHPSRMREFCALGIEVCGRYEREWLEARGNLPAAPSDAVHPRP